MLTDDEQAAFEPVLRAREQELREQLESGLEAAKPVSLDEEIGRLTRMDAMQQQQMALHARRRLELQLEQVRGAFMRLEQGKFGSCAMCSESIPRARLDLTPETPFCIGCQQRIEHERAG